MTTSRQLHKGRARTEEKRSSAREHYEMAMRVIFAELDTLSQSQRAKAALRLSAWAEEQAE